MMHWTGWTLVGEIMRVFLAFCWIAVLMALGVHFFRWLTKPFE